MTATEREWGAYLRAFHAQRPNATPEFFARWPLLGGDTSYARLAAELDGVHGVRTIVDLACGNGHLIGDIRARAPRAHVVALDMCAEEVARARERFGDDAISYACADASCIPLGDAGADVVLSHMAFMLMAPIEPVVAELARVIRAGGRFSAMVGRPFRDAPGVMPELSERYGRALADTHPEMARLGGGDRRSATAAGVRTLFAAAGREVAVQQEDTALVVRCRPAEVWSEVFAGLYFSDAFSDAESASLARAMREVAAPFADESGTVRVDVPVALIRVDFA